MQGNADLCDPFKLYLPALILFRGFLCVTMGVAPKKPIAWTIAELNDLAQNMNLCSLKMLQVNLVFHVRHLTGVRAPLLSAVRWGDVMAVKVPMIGPVGELVVRYLCIA